MDVCYHDPCDSLTPEEDNAPPGVHDALAATGYQLYGNLNTYAFDVNADAVATAIVKFAYDTSPVNGVASTASARAASATAGAASTDVHGNAKR